MLVGRKARAWVLGLALMAVGGGGALAEAGTTDDLMDTTPGRIGHVAINADDVDASKAFYAATFGWTFEPHFEQDDFFRISDASGEQPGPFAIL